MHSATPPSPGPKVGLLALVVLALAACGSDTTDSSTASVLPARDAAAVAYCETSLDLERAVGSVTEPTPDALRAIQPQIDAFVAAAPTEVSTAAHTLADTVSTVIDGGDPSVLDGPELAAATDTAHAYDLAHCGWQQVQVGLIDTSFQVTLPTTAGVYSFEGTNTGTQFHVIGLGRLRDDAEPTAKEAWDAVMSATDGEAEFGKHFDDVTGTGIAPGATGHAVGELTPGQYVMFCPIPMGSDAAHEFQGDGAPHFMSGMLQFFTIT